MEILFFMLVDQMTITPRVIGVLPDFQKGRSLERLSKQSTKLKDYHRPCAQCRLWFPGLMCWFLWTSPCLGRSCNSMTCIVRCLLAVEQNETATIRVNPCCQIYLKFKLIHNFKYQKLEDNFNFLYPISHISTDLIETNCLKYILNFL